MSKICKALSLMKVKHDKQKSEAIEEHRELLRLAKIGEAVELVKKTRRCEIYVVSSRIMVVDCRKETAERTELMDWHRREVSND